MGINEYFESIKHDKSKLRQFVSDMPKGGDLHNHLIGSVYGETYFDIACENHMYVDMNNGKLYTEKPNSEDKGEDKDKEKDKDIETFQLPDEIKNLHECRMTLIDKWSVRNFQPYKYPLGPDEYFFSTFGMFLASASDNFLPRLVDELKQRAKKENVQYLEVIGLSPNIPPNAFLDSKIYSNVTQMIDDFCKNYVGNSTTDEESINEFIRIIEPVISIYNVLYNSEGSALRIAYDDYIKANISMVKECSSDDVIIKFQGYASRSKASVDVLAQLFIIFKAMREIPDILVGCNLVAAENNENSMKYYRAEMSMFNYFINYYPKRSGDISGYITNTSLHAGELTMGLVQPEHLTYHINDAVKTGAKRIGHGVDIVFEHDSDKILRTMVEKDIAVEINLTSNEFILGVRDDSHPFMLYKDYGVPMVISTDDPGILRTSLTDEYVKAIYRYNLSYNDVLCLANNSIKYSFLNDNDKKKVFDRYNNELCEFEKKYSSIQQGSIVNIQGVKKGMFMHYSVTGQTYGAYNIKLINKDTNEVIHIWSKNLTPGGSISEIETGSLDIPTDNLVIDFGYHCKVIIIADRIISSDGKSHGIVHNILSEDGSDEDYNDISIQLVSWDRKN